MIATLHGCSSRERSGLTIDHFGLDSTCGPQLHLEHCFEGKANATLAWWL